MFTWTFWILAIWLVINAIYSYMKRDDKHLLKIFAWINVIAIIAGFWVFYGGTPQTPGLAVWFQIVNWVNVVLAICQFYVSYKKADSNK